MEITGLVASTLIWLDELRKAGKFPFEGVEADSEFYFISFSNTGTHRGTSLVNGTRRLVTYREWANIIKANFESHYFIPSGTSEISFHYIINY